MSGRRSAVAGRAVWLAGCWALAAAAAACARPARDRADLQPPPDWRPPPARQLGLGPLRAERLGFGPGFHPIEIGADGKTWRWMGGRGEIRLRNEPPGDRSRGLIILGRVPLELLPAPPRVRITLDGHEIDNFVASDRRLRREVLVPRELVGSAATALLVIETSATARAPGDIRDLGVAIERVVWAAPGP